MTFRDWQLLAPDAAARELHHRVRERLSSAQQRAVLAFLPDEPSLTRAFAASNRATPLGGVPYLLKDLFDVAGLPTFAGSTFLPEVRPASTTNAALVRTLQSAGAVFAGKAQLHEFAYGITGENPHYGDCEHPRFPGRTSGGSSSGSAAAVAAGVVPFAIGTDTGGSVRVPAAFCGVFGFRLQPCDSWIADAFPLAPSFDTAGWFTANAADMRLAISALIDVQPAREAPRGCYLDWPDLEPDVARACRESATRFAPPADRETGDALLAGFSSNADAYNTIVAVEAWQVHQAWAQRFRNRYDPAVRQRLNRVHTLTAAQIDAAQRRLAATRDLWAKFFQSYDFLVLPATPFGALTKPECSLAKRNRLLALTAPASLGGLPVLTIPVPLPSGLTSGLQIVVKDPRSPVSDWALSQ